MPTITSLSRNGADSTSSNRPDVRSSATRRMVSTAASTGSAGAAESAHSTATGVSPPSPARSAFAKSPPDTPRNTITANVVDSDPASTPNVRIMITRVVLIPQPPRPSWTARP